MFSVWILERFANFLHVVKSENKEKYAKILRGIFNFYFLFTYSKTLFYPFLATNTFELEYKSR